MRSKPGETAFDLTDFAQQNRAYNQTLASASNKSHLASAKRQDAPPWRICRANPSETTRWCGVGYNVFMMKFTGCRRHYGGIFVSFVVTVAAISVWWYLLLM